MRLATGGGASLPHPLPTQGEGRRLGAALVERFGRRGVVTTVDKEVNLTNCNGLRVGVRALSRVYARMTQVWS
jgi:hypothetical protein